MRLVQRDPSTAYVDRWLWVPKRFTNVEGVRGALSFSFADRYSKQAKHVFLWRETEHHLLVPRHFWEVSNLPYRVVDLRPQQYATTNVTSRIKLDHRMRDGVLLPDGNDVQRKSFDALCHTPEGVLQLACVSGSTTLNLNRGGKGFKVSIADAYKRSTGSSKHSWDPSIPTYIRSHKGNQIGLQRVISFIYSGEKYTYEVCLEDGKKLRLTEDHEVLTPDGFKALKMLKPGDQVITDGNRKESVRKKKPVYKRIGGFKYHPYSRYQTRSYCIEEHRAIVEASLNELTLKEFKDLCRIGKVDQLQFINPEAHHIHHKDGDVKNNTLSNLEVLPKETHLRGHRPGAQAFGYGIPTAVKITHIHHRIKEHVYDVACESPHNNFVANGVVVHNCGKGKTPIALHFAAHLNTPVLVILPDSQLFEQWKVEIGNLLEVPGGIGFIHGTNNDWQKAVVLTTYHTIGARANSLPEEVRRWFGLIIWDEGHHIPAPTFADSAECFYGHRLSLTATPERADGMHVISQHHIGPVIYKDLTPVQKPRIFFKWTGLEIDESRPEADVRDKNGEIHGSKVSSYNARWPERRTEILNDAAHAVYYGRKVLVLSSSEAEIANMAAMWASGNIGLQPTVPLYSDIATPIPADVGEVLSPIEMGKTEHHKRLKQSLSLRKKARAIPLDSGYCDAYEKWCHVTKMANNQKDRRKASRLEAEAESLYLWIRNDFFLNYHTYASRLHGSDLETVNALYGVEQALQQHIVHKKLKSELERRQRNYIETLYKGLKNCGIMVYKVPAQERKRFLDEMPIIFAITKYGKEGMNSEELDTILVSSIFSSQNGLQQLNGRHTRDFHGKKSPVTVFYEDNVGHVIGMCQKLKKHLREWPHDEGGPYDYETIGHPHVIHRSGTWQNNIQRIFGH